MVLETHFAGASQAKGVMLVEPQRMNPRLAVQQGCFVVPGDLSRSFMENLADSLEVDVAVVAAKKVRSMLQVNLDQLFDTPIRQDRIAQKNP